MKDRYTLLFQKGEGTVVNSFTEWGIICSKVPFKAGGKTKKPESVSLPDEHGEIVPFTPYMTFEAYDAEFEMAYKGEELATNPFNLSLAFSQIDNFKKWLSGNDIAQGSGTELKIYSPYSSIGRQKCYLSEIGYEVPCLQLKQTGSNLYNENVVTFKVTFRVTDPITNIILNET